jgi:hypothetical protein
MVAVLIAGCARSTPPTTPTTPTSSGQVGIIPVLDTAEVRLGQNRMIFTLVDASERQKVAAPDRTLTVAFRGPNGASVAPAPFVFIWAVEGQNGVYIGHPTFSAIGTWIADFTTEAPGSPTVSLSNSFIVKATTKVLSPGSVVPAIDTPTTALTGGDLRLLTTDPEPVPRFYTTSVAAAVSSRKPFVVVFATPKFCTAKACGPTLDRVKVVANAHPELTFIHLEPYPLQLVDGTVQPVLDSTGAMGVTDATAAFGLQNEPAVFVVASDGLVAAYFELVFTPDEIESAIATVEKG